MTEAIPIRRARPDDARALARLGRDSFTSAFAHLYRPEDLAAFLAENHSPEQVARELAKPFNVYFVAEDDGLQGYARLVLACGWPEHARGHKVVELKQLYTAPGNTGRGIGAALMSKVIEAARAEGGDEIQLSVWQGNHGAQRFYARYGFERIADVHFQVGSQTDDEYLFAAML